MNKIFEEPLLTHLVFSNNNEDKMHSITTPRYLMRSTKILLLTLLLVPAWLFATDFSHFSDICDVTPTQTCPNHPEEVKALQDTLNSDPSLYLYIKANGKWGKGTKEAVIVFQEHYGITPASGYVGARSRMVLQKIANATTGTVNKVNKPASVKISSAKSKKHTPNLPDAAPTKEFILYGDMCDNHVEGNNCPNKLIEVSNLQILLNADPNLNINISADGKWGKGTQSAIVAFQQYYNISPASGYVGPRTKRMLDRVAGAMVARATMPAKKKKAKKSTNNRSTSIATWKDICETTEENSCPNRPEDVRALQSFLNRTLRLNLTVDGKWGNGTKRAVITFQKKNNIAPASGYVGRKTRRIMQRIARKTPSKTHSRAATKRKRVKHTIRTHADFRKYTNYPKTFRVYKDKKLLARASGKNTQIKIDVSEQRMKMYVNGKVALDSPCTTGAKRKLEPNTKTIRNKSTPKGSFRITEKLADKRSTIFGNIYRNGKKIYHGDRRKYKGSWNGVKFVGASLKNWMRLTSSGIGLHGSKYVKRYPASNGCVRLPYRVANVVFSKVKHGTTVKITR
jgi:peptidoglycan hydrolase-like protein with peptidoglycan-binding domain